MEREERLEQYCQYAERLIKAVLEEGVAGGMIGPDGLTLGEPNWEERAKHQRFSERVKTHGYPLGFAKSQHRVRDRLVQDLQRRVEALEDAGRARYADAHEALAWALDAERVLGSFNQGERGGFPVETVDRVAEHVLAWLETRGYAVVPTSETSPQ